MSGRRTASGFTIIELLVVIIVIGILASIVLIGYSRVSAQGRDARRTADLEAISDAITAYRLRLGDQVTSSSCPTSGDGTGNGWFNYVGACGSKTILSCLTDQGYLSSKYVDPTGCATTTGAAAPGLTCTASGYAYMKTTCVEGSDTVTYLIARMETKGNVADLQGAKAHSSSTTYASNYGMNYMIKVD